MLVCPNCREVSDEGMEVCAQCGHSLSPGLQPMTSMRRPGAAVGEIDASPPAPPRVWPRVAGAVVVLLAGTALAVWLVVRPQACDGKFSSDRFAYCVAVPAGWTAQPATIGSVQVDQFVGKGEEAMVVVIAFSLRPGTDLATYATAARQRDREAGLRPGPLTAARLGDERALQWDLHVTGKTTQAFRAVEVVAVHEAVGWTLQLDATEASFTHHVPALESMLSSWDFR